MDEFAYLKELHLMHLCVSACWCQCVCMCVCQCVCSMRWKPEAWDVMWQKAFVSIVALLNLDSRDAMRRDFTNGCRGDPRLGTFKRPNEAFSFSKHWYRRGRKPHCKAQLLGACVYRNNYNVSNSLLFLPYLLQILLSLDFPGYEMSF